VAFQAFSQSSLTVPASAVRFNSNVRPQKLAPWLLQQEVRHSA
jgi:hypothetical protein